MVAIGCYPERRVLSERPYGNRKAIIRRVISFPFTAVVRNFRTTEFSTLEKSEFPIFLIPAAQGPLREALREPECIPVTGRWPTAETGYPGGF